VEDGIPLAEADLLQEVQPLEEKEHSMDRKLCIAGCITILLAGYSMAEDTSSESHKELLATPKEEITAPSSLAEGKRLISEEYNELQPFVVRIILDKKKIRSNTILYEEIPESWKLIASSPPWTHRPFRSLYQWDLSESSLPDEIRYILLPPIGFNMEKEFNGFMVREGFRSNIMGMRYVYRKEGPRGLLQ
jgi:hypothetical protein